MYAAVYIIILSETIFLTAHYGIKYMSCLLQCSENYGWKQIFVSLRRKLMSSVKNTNTRQPPDIILIWRAWREDTIALVAFQHPVTRSNITRLKRRNYAM